MNYQEILLKDIIELSRQIIDYRIKINSGVLKSPEAATTLQKLNAKRDSLMKNLNRPKLVYHNPNFDNKQETTNEVQ